MKRKLLFLGLVLLSVSRIFGQTDISDHSKVDSYILTANRIYDGSTLTPSVILTDKATSVNLVSGTDYTVSYTLNGNSTSEIKNAGSYQVIVNGIGNYTGQIITPFTITPADLDNVVVTGVNTTYPYTGSPIEPPINVTLDGNAVSSNDYTLAYGTNTNVNSGGTITLTPSSNDNFTGQKVTNFTITPIDISTAITVITLSQSSYTYNGSIITPTIQSVTVNGTTLTGSDYTVNNPGAGTNTNVGNGIISITGTGNYTGSASQQFTITAADLSTATITLNPASYAYTGSTITPTIQSVVVGGQTLVLNTDYSVNMPPAGTNTEVGTGTVGITGIGNYMGSASQTFSITGVTLTADMFVAIATKVYTGSPITLDAADITTSFNSNPLVFGTDYTITGYLNNTEAGTATVTFEGAGHFSGQVTKTFEIAEEPLTADMFTIADKTYTGDSVKLVAGDITAKDAQQQTLTLGTDFDIQSYANDINAGTATVILVGKGDYSGTVPVNFNIKKVALNANMFTIANKTYTGSAVELIETDITGTFNSKPLTYGTDFTLGTYTNNTNTGTASVIISGAGNFEGDVTVNFTISISPLTTNMFKIIAKTYTGNPIALTGSDITAVNNGDTLVLETDYTLGTYTNNTNAGTATITINGAGNYNGSSVSVPFTIAPAPLAASMFTTISNKSYTGAHIELATQDITSSLVYNKDYTIGAYNHNINAGTATVVFNGKGNYTGSTTPVNFTITPVALTANMVTIPNQYYTGSMIQPQPIVKLGNTILANSNFTISYPDTQTGAYIQKGTYNVKIDPVANGNLTGSVTASFNILDAPATLHKITIPQVSGITTDPPAGTYDVTDGNYFTIYITKDPSKELIVKVNGVEVIPHYAGNNRYQVTITDIEDDIQLEILTEPVNNWDIAPVAKVYSVNNMLYIETDINKLIQVFSMNGQLSYKGYTNNAQTTIPLARGIYIVKIEKETFKVSIK